LLKKYVLTLASSAGGISEGSVATVGVGPNAHWRVS